MSAMSGDEPTRRFSERVEYYVRYRPGYPSGLVEFFRRELQRIFEAHGRNGHVCFEYETEVLWGGMDPVNPE